MGASRNGLCTVILPKRNEFDLEDVPENVRSEMHFIFAERVDDVCECCTDVPRRRTRTARSLSRSWKLS